MDLEFHQLELRYEHLRVRHRERERRLVASLAEVGQQVPIVVLGGGDQSRFILVDGYKRVRALQRLSSDTVRATRWELDEVEALVMGRLMRAAEPETALEQGWLLREMTVRFRLSQDELARRFDRSESWVSRRLALVRELPDTVQQHIVEGRIVPQIAMKVLVPLARAKRDECERMAEAIATARLSVREAAELNAAYREAGPRGRDLVLADPRLALKARREALGAVPADPASPEESLLKDLEIVAAVARRALKRLCEGPPPNPNEHDVLLSAYRRAQIDVERAGRQLIKETHGAGSEPTSFHLAASPAGP